MIIQSTGVNKESLGIDFPLRFSKMGFLELQWGSSRYHQPGLPRQARSQKLENAKATPVVCGGPWFLP